LLGRHEKREVRIEKGGVRRRNLSSSLFSLFSGYGVLSGVTLT